MDDLRRFWLDVLDHASTSGGEFEKATQDFLSEAKAVQVLLPKAEEKLERFSSFKKQRKSYQRDNPKRTD